jgi:hypothetical protein
MPVMPKEPPALSHGSVAWVSGIRAIINYHGPMCFLLRAAGLQQKSAEIQKDKEGRRSFLKKRTKRLLLSPPVPLSGPIPDLCASAEAKVFWFFSSEKNTLPLTY